MKFYMDYQWLSPYTYTIFCALREKKIDFELIDVVFKRGHTLTPGFSDLTPAELIPVLDDQAEILFESLAILEYLDEKFRGSPIFPSDLRARAQARTLLSWYRCGMTALRKERSTELIFYPSLREKIQPLSTEALEEVRDLSRYLNTLLKPGAEFLFGRWSIADTETALMLQRLLSTGETVDPLLAHYAQAIWKRPSAHEFVSYARPRFEPYY